MCCTTIMSGSVTMAVQSVAAPRLAPAGVYVPIPDGSSSEAPVIKPGPRRPNKFFSGFLFFSVDGSIDIGDKQLTAERSIAYDQVKFPSETGVYANGRG